MAYPTGWGRKCELVIQHSQVTADCTDFPVLVTKDTLDSEIFDADGSYPALNGGGDIRFSSDSAGTAQIPCEIEQFVTDNDPANGKSAVWTKRTLSSAANTSIWIWYNKSGESQPAEDNAYGKENAWDSNFKMVQHMNQDPSGTSPQMIDSTSNNNDGSSRGTMQPEDQVAGKIAGSLDHDGTGDCIYTGSISLPVDFTLSGWMKFNASSADYGLMGGVDTIQIWRDNAATDHFAFGIRNSGGWSIGYGSIVPDTSSYYHVTMTFNDTTDIAKMYINAQQDGSDLSVTPIGDLNIERIGATESSASKNMSGIIDEARISNVVRTVGWIETEYNNQNSPGTFIIEGTPETPGSIILTIAEALSSSALDNVALTQKHVLAVQALDSAGILDNVDLIQKHTLIIQELLSAGSLDNVALIQKHILIIQELLSAGSLDNVALIQKNTLELQSLLSNGTIDVIDLITANTLVVQGLLSVGAIDNIDLIRTYALVVQGLISAGILDNIDLVQKHLLSVQPLSSIGTIDNVDLIASVLLIVNDLLTSGTIDNINFDVLSGIISMVLSETTEYDVELSREGGG